MIGLLSVIVHGRNDSHGYNLHKRVALSLNCVGHLLSGNDEIIFVDWNTPDDLPSLPEAIADTLTDACRQRLRILRVRPHQHRGVCGVSHLPTLDAVARNVALRRLAPSSNWVLSTTTDIIPVPRHPDKHLAEIVAALDVALYHLPRFDVPESLWETLDRRDPATAIAQFRTWGPQFHLHEIVEAGPIVKFDGPGDFQLLPVAAAIELNGFDERMVFTYHTDSNLAKRASLLLGPVQGLWEELSLYHCNHYRQVSVHHGPRRAENSWRRFVEEVDRPDLRDQAESWGLAGEAIEEIFIDQQSRLRTVSTLAAILPLSVAPWAVRNDTTSYNDLGYRSEHVLPFVVDLLSTLPKDSVLGIFASTRDIVGLVGKAWGKLGFALPILVGEAGGLEDDIIEHATVLLFEFGNAGQEAPFTDATVLSRLAWVDAAFRRAVTHERTASERSDRRFIVVNAINTVFEKLVADNLAFTYTPFTGRVRYGIVAREEDPLATDIASLSRWLGHKMGRRLPVPYQEVVAALDTLTASRRAAVIGPALALLDHPRLAEALNIHPELWQKKRALSRMQRTSFNMRTALLVPRRVGVPNATPALSKLASIDDWENPEWHESLVACDAAFDTADFLRRHRGTWEMTQLLYAARKGVPGGMADMALAVLGSRSALPIYLLQRARRLVVVPAGGSHAARFADLWPPGGRAYDPARIRGLDGLAMATGNELYGLIVVPDNALLAEGVDGLPDRLAALEAMLALGGVIIIAAEVVIAGGAASDRLSGGIVACGNVEGSLTRHTGLRAVGSVDWAMSEATLDCLAVAGAPSEQEPHFVIQIGKVFSTTAVWTLRKIQPTSPAAWSDFTKDWKTQLR